MNNENLNNQENINSDQSYDPNNLMQPMNNNESSISMNNEDNGQASNKNISTQENVVQSVTEPSLQNNNNQSFNEPNNQNVNNVGIQQNIGPNNLNQNGPVNLSENNSAGIRKALKKDSKSKIKGYLIGATAIMFIGIIVLSALATSFSNSLIQEGATIEQTMPKLGGFILFAIIISLFVQLFNYGITTTSFDIARGKESSLGNVFSKLFSNFKAIIILFVVLEALEIITSILTGIPLIGGLLSLIAMIYMYPAYDMLLCMYADDNYQKLSWLDMIKKSQEIVKGHRVEYYGTLLSFIGWILLSLITCGIMFIWVYPYIRLTIVNMYRRWLGEANYNSNESGLSNGAVIGLSIGGYIVGVITFVFVLIAILFSMTGTNNLTEALNNLKNGQNNSYETSDTYKTPDSYGILDENKIPKTITIGNNISKVTFISPKGKSLSYYNYDGSTMKQHTFTSYSSDNEWGTIEYEYNAAKSANDDYVLDINYFIRKGINYEEFTTLLNNVSVKCIGWEADDYNGYNIYYPLTNNSYIKIKFSANFSKHIERSDIQKYIKIKS